MSDRAKTVLYINLTKKTSKIKVHSDLGESLGGVSLGVVLFSDLYEKDPIIFSNGPLSALFPCCSDTVAIFKSPLSGNLGEAYAGGWLAAVMRFATLNAIVITGESETPIFLNIENERVEFKEAASFWGKGNFETYKYLESHEGLPGQKSILTIGQAGEKEIAFASVTVDCHFFFQRLGLGAVFGKKKLKGIVISGTKSEPISDPVSFKLLYQEIIDLIAKNRSENTPKQYIKIGDIRQLIIENELGGLPTKNLKETRFENAADISGEVFTSFFVDSNIASFGCPIGTTLLVAFKDRKLPISYEVIASLGALLGICEPKGLLKLVEKSYDLGLDPVSLGVCLAYLTEKEGLTFSDVSSYATLIDTLIKRTEPWAKQLSCGVEKAAKELGGQDYALSIGGVEISPYFNGYGTVFGQIIGARHSVYDNDAHLLDLSLLGRDFNEVELVDTILAEEKKIIVLNSLIVNQFGKDVYSDMSVIFKVLNTVGVSLSHESLEKLSNEVYHLKLGIKKMLGFDIDQVRIPERLLETPSAYGILKREKLKRMIEIYKEKTKGQL